MELSLISPFRCTPTTLSGQYTLIHWHFLGMTLNFLLTSSLALLHIYLCWMCIILVLRKTLKTLRFRPRSSTPQITWTLMKIWVSKCTGGSKWLNQTLKTGPTLERSNTPRPGKKGLTWAVHPLHFATWSLISAQWSWGKSLYWITLDNIICLPKV
jgi:hypothetical protein